MWTSFFIDFILALVMLYLPGALFGSLFRMPTVLRLAFAPIISITLYEILAIAYQKLSIFANFFSIFIPVLVISAVVCGVSIAVRRSRKSSCGKVVGCSFRWSLLAAYVGVAFVVGMLFFVKALDGTDTFLQAWDNAFHLNVVRYFVDSGNYSALCVTNTVGASPVPGTAYYPAAWHLLCAAITSVVGSTVPTTINAVNFAFASVVFPAGMYCFVGRVLGNNRIGILVGALLSSAFASFPWSFLTYGPLFPNLASMSLLPAALTVMMGMFDYESSTRQRLSSLVCSVFAVVSFGFAQPNSVFTAIVVLFPYACVEFCQIAEGRGLRIANLRKCVFYLICCALFVALWAVFYVLPPLHAPYTVNWPAFASHVQAVANVLSLAYIRSQASLLLALLVIVGIANSLKNRAYCWVSVAYVVTCVMLIVAESSDGFLKTFLTGLWYTDQYRVAAMCGIAATPLACIGAARIVELVKSIYPKVLRFFDWRDRSRYFGVLTSLVVAVCLFVPSFSIPGVAHFDTAFGGFRDDVEFMYSASAPNVLDASEREFLEEATQIVNEDPGLVINQSFDGSAYAYGLYGLDVFYRSFGDVWSGSETEDSKSLRLHIDELSWNTDVQESARSVGAKYLLLLDYGKGDTGDGCLQSYVRNDWWGVNAVTDDTAGFKVLLAKDDMRLYRLVY